MAGCQAIAVERPNWIFVNDRFKPDPKLTSSLLNDAKATRGCQSPRQSVQQTGLVGERFALPVAQASRRLTGGRGCTECLEHKRPRHDTVRGARLALKAIDPKGLAETSAGRLTRSIQHLYLVSSQCTTNKRCENRQIYRPDSSLKITDHV